MTIIHSILPLKWISLLHRQGFQRDRNIFHFHCRTERCLQASKLNKAIILLGPTSSGKSEAAILLALELGSEIISADSMQLYRLMDIGTAKPSREELKVPHHLVDVIWPHEEWSAGSFAREAARIMEGLRFSQGKIPIVAGGTGLYIKTLTRGLAPAPEVDDKLRAELSDINSEQDLYALLASLDPECGPSSCPQGHKENNPGA